MIRDYRKMPVVIQAAIFDGSWFVGKKILDWMDKDWQNSSGVRWTDKNGGILLIDTKEGMMAASAGDYIIRGVAGEFYPCKPDIFAKTYESA